jgi:uncharacterized protein (UPF0264 family)
MTQLLVSVRSAEEAREALRGGADIIDVKEPAAGSLGAAAPVVCREVLEAVDGRVPVSMALGELLDAPAAAVPAGMAFAKLGLAGAAGWPDWDQRWLQRRSELPEPTRAVAVVYADWRHARAPSPGDVLRVAAVAGSHAVLVDTSDKRAGDLFAHMTDRELRKIRRLAADNGMQLVLAGSLHGAAIERALDLHPDVLAVRGAVCRPDRQGRLQADKVARLADCVHRMSNSLSARK